MDWNKQAETMMQTWTEAQKTMWQNWFSLVQNATNNNASQSPFSFNGTDWMQQWQRTAMQGFNAWSSGDDPMARNMAQQLVMSQEMMMRFLQMMTQTWQAIAPKVEAGEDWRSVINDYSKQWFQSMAGGPTGMMSVSKDINELWQFYVQEWQKISQPWIQSLMASPTNLGQLLMGGNSELAALSNFHWDAYERTVGRMTEIPGLGMNRELNIKIMNGFEAWVEMQKMMGEYYAHVSKTWTQAFETFIEKLVKMSEEGKVIDSVQDLMNLWFDTVDETFMHTYVSEEYLGLQKNLSAAAMKNKMRQQEILEVFLGMLDLPTRSELDDAYRSLNDLRKEVRGLKREMKALKSVPAPQAAAKPTASTDAVPKESTTSTPTVKKSTASPTAAKKSTDSTTVAKKITASTTSRKKATAKKTEKAASEANTEAA